MVAGPIPAPATRLFSILNEESSALLLMEQTSSHLPFNEDEPRDTISYRIPLNARQLNLLSYLHQEALLAQNDAIVRRVFPSRLFVDFRASDEDLQETLGWNQRKLTEVGRELQGIFAICDEGERVHIDKVARRIFHTLSFQGYSLPKANQEAAVQALSNGGIFEKELHLVDIPVLREMFRLDNALKERRGSAGKHLPPPRFDPTELAKALSVPREQITESLQRMIGLIGRTQTSYLHVKGNNSFTSYSHKWFIPPAHRGIIQELLSAYE